MNLSKLNPFYKNKLKSVNFAYIGIILWAIIFSIILSIPVIYLFLKITFGFNLFVDFIFNYKILKIAIVNVLNLSNATAPKSLSTYKETKSEPEAIVGNTRGIIILLKVLETLAPNVLEASII